MKLLATIDALTRTAPSFRVLADEAATLLGDAMPHYRRVDVVTADPPQGAVPVRWGGEAVAWIAVEASGLNAADALLLGEVAALLAVRWGRDHDSAGAATVAVVGGGFEIPASARPVFPPVHGSVSYLFDDMQALETFQAHPERGFEYTRLGNPTVRAAEEAIARLEGAEASVLHASGMAAIANAVLSVVSAGDELLSAVDTYGGTHHLFTQVLPRLGIKVRFAPTEALAEAITPGTRAVYFEPITNPSMRVADLSAIVAAARAVGALTIVDNTVASPVFLRPLAHGVDLVVHSATKYLGGHSDLMAGVASGSRSHTGRIETLVSLLGACFNPREASLLIRGLKTLDLRVRRQDASARVIAEWLSRRPEVRSVSHPSLPSHPDHDRAARLLDGLGCLVTFDLHDGSGARRMVDALTRFARAASLGAVESLVTLPVLSSHWKVDPESLARAGVSAATVRLSIGVEDVGDLIADLERALRASS